MLSAELDVCYLFAPAAHQRGYTLLHRSNCVCLLCRHLGKTANLMTAPQGVVWKAMWRRHGRVFAIAGLIKLVHDCVMFLGPFVLEQLVKYLENGGTACKHDMPVHSAHLAELCCIACAF